MAKISIVDLAVSYHVGVPDAERAQPQRLLLTVDMETDFAAVAKSDSIADTINYYAVSQGLLRFGNGREWKLLEKLVDAKKLKLNKPTRILLEAACVSPRRAPEKAERGSVTRSRVKSKKASGKKERG